MSTELIPATSRFLVRFEAARRALEAARSVDELKDIADKAEALRLYLRQARESLEMQNAVAEIKLRAERRAGEMLREMNKNRGGNPNLLRPTTCSPPTLSELGISRARSHRWQLEASVPSATFERHVARVKDSGEELTSVGLLKLAKRLHREKRNGRIEHPRVNGSLTVDLVDLVDQGVRFGTIYADPPWGYDNESSRAAAINHYPTMSVDAIAKLPVRRLASENAHLFLWTTNAFIFECPRILSQWGFVYKSIFVWVKEPLGLGNYFRLSHEFLILAVRGDCPFRDRSQRSWRLMARGKHSEKPEEVRELIESVSPGPYLELFGRRVAKGWTVWGNESLNTDASDG